MPRIDLQRPHFRPVDVSAFCKQSVPAEAVSWLRSSKAHLPFWSRQGVILAIERRLFDALRAGHWRLEEIGAKRWKGGWLIYVKCRQPGSPLRRWNSFGATPNEALANAAGKLSNWGFETKEWQ